MNESQEMFENLKTEGLEASNSLTKEKSPFIA